MTDGRLNVKPGDPLLSEVSERERNINFEEREEGIRSGIANQENDFVGIYGSNHLSNIQGYTDQEIADSEGNLERSQAQQPLNDKTLFYVNSAPQEEHWRDAYEHELDDPEMKENAQNKLGEMNYYSNPNNAFQAVLETDEWAEPEQAREIAIEAGARHREVYGEDYKQDMLTASQTKDIPESVQDKVVPTDVVNNTPSPSDASETKFQGPPPPEPSVGPG